MKEYPKADLGARFVAALIDGVLSSLVSTLIPILGAIASTIYLLFKDGLFEGQSLGKRVMKLQVVDGAGKPADYRVSVQRNIIFAIPAAIMIVPILGWVIAPLVGLVVLIIELVKVLNDPKGRRVGDQWADTQVVMLDDVLTADDLTAGPAELKPSTDDFQAPDDEREE